MSTVLTPEQVVDLRMQLDRVRSDSTLHQHLTLDLDTLTALLARLDGQQVELDHLQALFDQVCDQNDRLRAQALAQEETVEQLGRGLRRQSDVINFNGDIFLRLDALMAEHSSDHPENPTISLLELRAALDGEGS